jgi:hypothetical protein
MTDKKLLELAAKAAGFTWKWNADYLLIEDESWHEWNPLTDDGDALRLAVKCSIDVWFDDDCKRVGTNYMIDNTGYNLEEEWLDSTKQEATRRAITRAAAEIGKTK